MKNDVIMKLLAVRTDNGTTEERGEQCKQFAGVWSVADRILIVILTTEAMQKGDTGSDWLGYLTCAITSLQHWYWSNDHKMYQWDAGGCLTYVDV